MNKKHYVLFLVVITIGFLFVAGCTTNSTSVSTSQSPSQVFEQYLNSYKAVNSEQVYNLLSDGAKKSVTKDDVHNTIYALKQQGVGIKSYKILDEQISGSDATVKAEITWDVIGYQKTQKYEIPFVLENGKWKLNKFFNMGSSTGGSSKNVGVTVNTDALTWQGGTDISNLVSWAAKFEDGTIIASGGSVVIGQVDKFNQNVNGKRVTITAKFSDGTEQILFDKQF